MKIIRLIIMLILLTFLFILFSCNETTLESEIKDFDSQNALKRVVTDTVKLDEKYDIGPKMITPFTEEVTKWKFDHYAAKSGKIFGIWPHNDRELTIGNLQELRIKFGFNYISHDYHDGTQLYQYK